MPLEIPGLRIPLPIPGIGGERGGRVVDHVTGEVFEFDDPRAARAKMREIIERELAAKRLSAVAPAPTRPLPKFPGEPVAPPAQVPPAPEPFRPVGPPPSGGMSPESIRKDVERVISDTDTRRNLPAPAPKGVIEGEVIARRTARGVGGAIARGIVRGVLGPIGVLWGILEPSELGSGELSPEERARNVERELARIEREREKLEAARRAAHERAFPTPAPLPAPVAEKRPPVVRQETRSAPTPAPSIPFPAPLPAPAPTRAPAPSRAPTPQRSRRTAPTPTTPQFPWPQVAQILGRGLFPSTPRSQTLTPPRSSLTVPSTPRVPRTATPVPTPLTPVNPQVLGSAPPITRTPTQQDTCRCQPKRKKRDKERECRARAPLVWAGGPKKGQPAGTRCISFRDL